MKFQATAPLRQTENARLSQVVNTRSVEELQVNGRNIMNLTALVSGAVAQGATTGDAITGTGNVKMAPGPDSISEFRVQAGLAIATNQTARVDVNLKVRNPCFTATLQNGVQPRSESTSTLGDL